MDHIEHPQRADSGGGWISGPMTGGPNPPTRGRPAPAVDNRPQYNPDMLVSDVVRLLRGAGIQVDLTNRTQVAIYAAADLLSALGVKPANAPLRSP